MNDKQLKFLEDVANSNTYQDWIDVFKALENEVADIRNNPKLPNEVRLGVIEVLEDMLIKRLKSLKGENINNDNSYE